MAKIMMWYGNKNISYCYPCDKKVKKEEFPKFSIALFWYSSMVKTIS